MNPFAREDYLAAEVFTATPQKLQLMLLDGALRTAQKTLRLWQARQFEQAAEPLTRCQEIVNSLLAGMARAPKSPLVERLIGVYAFVYRRLIEAGALRSETILQEAIRVLEIERGTWRQICAKLGGSPSAPLPDDGMGTGSLGNSFVA